MKKIITLFIIFSIFYMFIGVILGGLISGGPIAKYAETEEGHWLEAEHAFVNYIGFFSFSIMGLVYYFFPLLRNKSLFSKNLAFINFIFLNIGLFMMMIFTFTLHFLHFSFSSIGIMIGGIFLTLGYILFGINILKSL